MLNICLIRKISLIRKLMMPKTGKQTIKIHILPNISRSKVNKTIQFGQMINIFLEKPYTKCDGESILRPFSKKSKLSVCLDQ